MRDRKKAHFPGAIESQFVTDLRFIDDKSVIPTYRVLDIDGKIIEESHDPKVRAGLVRCGRAKTDGEIRFLVQISTDRLVTMYKHMITLNIMDTMWVWHNQVSSSHGTLTNHVSNLNSEPRTRFTSLPASTPNPACTMRNDRAEYPFT